VICFDKYRDRELDLLIGANLSPIWQPATIAGMKMSLLNNLVHVLKQEELRPMDLANQIARQHS